MTDLIPENINGEEVEEEVEAEKARLDALAKEEAERKQQEEARAEAAENAEDAINSGICSNKLLNATKNINTQVRNILTKFQIIYNECMPVFHLIKFDKAISGDQITLDNNIVNLLLKDGGTDNGLLITITKLLADKSQALIKNTISLANIIMFNDANAAHNFYKEQLTSTKHKSLSYAQLSEKINTCNEEISYTRYFISNLMREIDGNEYNDWLETEIDQNIKFKTLYESSDYNKGLGCYVLKDGNYLQLRPDKIDKLHVTFPRLEPECKDSFEVNSYKNIAFLQIASKAVYNVCKMVILDKLHSIYQLDANVPDQHLFFASARENIDYNCQNIFWNVLNLTSPQDDGKRSLVDNLINDMSEARSIEFLNGINNQIKPFNLSQSLIDVFGERHEIQECASGFVAKICASDGCNTKNGAVYSVSFISITSAIIDSVYDVQRFLQKDLINQVCMFVIGCAWKATWPYIKSKFSGRGYGDDTIKIIKYLHSEHGSQHSIGKYTRDLSHNDQMNNKKLDIFSIYKVLVDFKINRGSFPADENKPEFKRALLDKYTDHLEEGLLNDGYSRELIDQHHVEPAPYFYFAIGAAATACIAVNIINHFTDHYD